MERKLQLSVLVLLCTGVVRSSPYENLTVTAGQTLILNCSLDNATSDHLEWKNPQDFLLFFNEDKVLKDRRYRLLSLSDSAFTISLSDVNFKDGGYYKCLEYTDPIKTKLFKVTVVGPPKLETAEHEGKTAIKCSARANFLPPKISWLFESGLEVDAQPQHHCDSFKCTSVDMLLVRSYKRRTIVKCVVRHQALYDSYLLNFVAIGNNSIDEPQLTSTPRYVPSTAISKDQQSVPGTQFITDNYTSVLVTTDSTSVNVSVSNTTSTEGNLTEKEARRESRSPLLIFLVTCLIIALVVVMIFFGIKLKKTVALWKKENEDTDQSIESSKSKSSHEEKQFQERRGHGLHNTNYTKYVGGESAVTEADEEQARESPKESGDPPNGHAYEVRVTVETHEPETISQTKEIKETEL